MHEADVPPEERTRLSEEGVMASAGFIKARGVSLEECNTNPAHTDGAKEGRSMRTPVPQPQKKVVMVVSDE